MQKLLAVSFLLFVLIALNSKAFGTTNLNCQFKNSALEEVKSLRIKGGAFIINEKIEIPLSKTIVKCGHFGMQTRLFGEAYGYQIILKSCSTSSTMVGYINDTPNEVSADVSCDGELVL